MFTTLPAMHPLAILNTSIITSDGLFRLSTISHAEAVEIVQDNKCNILSAVGHQSTAEILSVLLPVSIPLNRIQFQQQVGQMALVFKLKGRPPEGHILTMNEIKYIGYDFQLLTRLE